MGDPFPVVGPPCPSCQSANTERLDFLAKKPQVFQCVHCGHFWFVKTDQRRLTRHVSVFSLLRRFPLARTSGWRWGVFSTRSKSPE